MSTFHNPEAPRLAALHALGVLDTPPEQRFDRFTRLAAKSFGVPIALISLVDERRQWFKSRCGLAAAETPRSMAFCAHAVAARAMLVVEDASRDPRFADSPLVTDEPGIRFYAGQPVFSEGEVVGTLCIIDRMPRSFDEADMQCLRDLADLVEVELNHAKASTARVVAEQSLKALNAELEQRVRERTTELEAKVEELSLEMDRRKAAEVSFREADAWNRTIVESSYSGFVGTDGEGRIIEWNASSERIFGWTRAQALGCRLSDLIVPEHLREPHEAGMRRVIATGEHRVIDKQMELPAMTASGRRITVEMTISAYDWKGQRCFGAFLNDISERNRMLQQLEEKQELLDAVLESVDVAIVACDALGNVTVFNRMARTMHGLDPKSIAPSEWPNYYSLYHADGRTPMRMDEVPLVEALRGHVVRDRAMAVAPHGRPMHMLLASGRPLRGAGGRVLGAVVAMKDITELNASRERLAAKEKQLRAVTENLPALIGKVDAQGRFAFLNSRALQFYGKSSEELIGQPVSVAYSAEAYARIRPYIQAVQGGDRVSFEDSIVIKGRELHYHCVYVPDVGPDGRCDGFFAMAYDISARKLGELRQAESEERLRTITDNLPVLISYLDGEGRYRFANAVHRSWLGTRPEDMLGKTIAEAFGGAEYDGYLEAQADALARAWSGQAAQCEHEIVRKKQARIAHSTFLPQVRDGVVHGVYVLTLDATASRLHERNLHALAHTDALTQLPNRRHFEQALDGLGHRVRQGDRGCALLYLDVDHFKQINDRFGHATGDAVLVEFARRLRSAVRGSDLVARLAGDEFTVLLTDVCSDADVRRVAGKVLEAVRQPFVLGGATLAVTTTIGACMAGRIDGDPRSLMDVADRALYAAKQAGRDTFAMLEADAALA
jgi:diguanylate cyclase (GGDEF)-like protein/PAS domain S-box-containing protein